MLRPDVEAAIKEAISMREKAAAAFAKEFGDMQTNTAAWAAASCGAWQQLQCATNHVAMCNQPRCNVQSDSAAMKEATSLREKEAAAFAKESGDMQTNIAVHRPLKTHLEQELEQHKVDRADAEAAIKEATSLREKEAAAFAKESGDVQTNIAVHRPLKTQLEQEKEQHKVDRADAEAAIKEATSLREKEAAAFDGDVISAFLSQGRVWQPRRGDILRRAFHGPSCKRCLECFGGR